MRRKALLMNAIQNLKNLSINKLLNSGYDFMFKEEDLKDYNCNQFTSELLSDQQVSDIETYHYIIGHFCKSKKSEFNNDYNNCTNEMVSNYNNQVNNNSKKIYLKTMLNYLEDDLCFDTNLAQREVQNAVNMASNATM